MKTLLVNIESADKLQSFMDVIKNLDFMKSVKLANNSIDEHDSLVLNETPGEYNWINPLRPATDEEIERLVVKMKNSTGGYSTEDVKEKMKKWAVKKSK